MKRIVNYFVSKQFLTFIFVGIINTFNGVLLSFLYSLFLDPNLSFILGYITSLTINYCLNSFITFKDNDISIEKFIKFSISYIPNFLIQNGVVFLVYNCLKFPNVIAYIMAAILGIPITFLLLKFFAFRKK